MLVPKCWRFSFKQKQPEHYGTTVNWLLQLSYFASDTSCSHEAKQNKRTESNINQSADRWSDR